MRRKDREMSAEFAYEVADKCEWMTVAVNGIDGAPYCTAVSPARDKNVMYFHCAAEGYRTECLRADGRVCVFCVGGTERQSDAFTTAYESAVIKGAASEVTDDEEKIRALRLICERHTPANMADFDNAVKRSLARTAVWKITIDEITGKAKLCAKK